MEVTKQCNLVLVTKWYSMIDGVMVKVFDLQSTCHRFDSRPFHIHVQTLSNLFTNMCVCHQAVYFGTDSVACKVTIGLMSH